MAPVVAFYVELMAVLAFLHGVGLYELVPMGPLGYGDSSSALAERAGVLHILKHCIAYKV